jgi:hypothetical protein
MSRIRQTGLVLAAVFVAASLAIGARSASAQGQSICHSIEPSATACESYCMTTYGEDYEDYHWNSGNGCCQCVF